MRLPCFRRLAVVRENQRSQRRERVASGRDVQNMRQSCANELRLEQCWKGSSARCRSGRRSTLRTASSGRMGSRFRRRFPAPNAALQKSAHLSDQLPMRQAANAGLLLFISAVVCLTSGAQEPDPTFKVNVKLVNVFVTVTDEHGAPIASLKKDNFELREDGKEQKISVFDKESALPLSIVLAVDTS